MAHGTAKALLERAQRRIDKLEGRENLATVDPLGCEIALAQLDATMSLSAAIQEATATIKGRVDVKVTQHTYVPSESTWKIQELERMMENIMSLVVLKEEPDTPEETDRKWWRFWNG